MKSRRTNKEALRAMIKTPVMSILSLVVAFAVALSYNLMPVYALVVVFIALVLFVFLAHRFIPVSVLANDSESST